MTKITVLSFALLLSWGGLQAQNDENQELNDCEEWYRQGKKQEALNCFLSYDAHCHAASYNAAIVARELGYEKTVKKMLKRLTRKKNRTRQSYLWHLDFFKDDTTAFTKKIKKGLRIFPDDTTLLAHKANIHAAKGEYLLAIETAEKLLTLQESQHEILWVMLGACYQKTGKIDLSLECYQTAIELDSSFFQPLYNTAVIYHNKGLESRQKQSNTSNKEENNRLYNEGDAFVKKALGYFKKAWLLKPESTECFNTLRHLYSIRDMEKEHFELMRLHRRNLLKNNEKHEAKDTTPRIAEIYWLNVWGEKIEKQRPGSHVAIFVRTENIKPGEIVDLNIENNNEEGSSNVLDSSFPVNETEEMMLFFYINEEGDLVRMDYENWQVSSQASDDV